VVQQALERLMVGRTTFIIAHRHAILRRATRILTLDRGVLVERAPGEPLITSPLISHEPIKQPSSIS
jgi:ABC-type multidrug transport system fused ATPase/permease subunit